MPSFDPTPAQQRLLEVSDWAFNGTRFRGLGRSTAMAYIAVKMAMEGNTVHLYDPSILLSHGADYGHHRRFSERVARVIEVYFPDHIFTFSALENTLRYVGPKVQPVAPVPVEIDDDGSEEE